MYRRSVSRVLACLALGWLFLIATGCYHSIIDTGVRPGRTAYHEKWESAWLVGLVPAEVDAEGVCEGPWARVETQQNFLNGLVTVLTLGIYAPHEVEVVCAAEVANPEASAAAEPSDSQGRLP